MTADGTGRRAGKWLVVLLGVALIAAGCTSSGSPADADVATSTTIPQARTLLRVGVEDWPDCLNPITCDSAVLRHQILEHVLPVAFELGDDGALDPAAWLTGRPSLEIGDSSMAVTYRIDPEARWHDGTPITSSDFRGTWQAMINTPGADREGYDQIAEVDDRDPSVAVVRFASPYAEWQQLFGADRGWLLQANAFGASTDLTGRFQAELPFSAGSYRLASWDDQIAVLTAVDEVPEAEGVPAVDQVRLVRLEAIADLVQPSAFDMLVPAAGEPGPTPDGFERRNQPTTSMLGIWFDRRTPLLDVLANRQILSVLVQRDELIPIVAGEVVEPVACLGWLPDVGPWCGAAAVDPRPTDPDLATFALFSEGWRPDPTFGTQVRDGEPFVVPINHDPAVPGATAVAEALADSFLEVGIGSAISELESAAWQAARGGDASTGVGVFALDLGISPLVDDVYGCSGGNSSSLLFWCPPELTGPTDALRSTLVVDRIRLLVESIGILADASVAWVPIAQLPTVSFVNPARVAVVGEGSVIGGPLGNLRDFQVAG